MSPAAAAPAPRPATPRDLDRILALYELLAEGQGPRFALRGPGDERLRAHLGARLREPEASLMVAERGADLAGFCLAARLERPAFFEERQRLLVEALFVRPEHRRGGLARALVEACLEALDPGRRLPVQLEVERGNAEGGAFWRALGFRPAMDVLERRR